MSVAQTWFEALSDDVRSLVVKMVGRDAPSDAQLEELPDLAANYGIEDLGLNAEKRALLQGAIDNLEKQITEADPRAKFLRMYDGEELAPAIVAFYEANRHAEYQHAELADTEYAPYPLFVDFENIGMLMNPDFAEEYVGETLEWADLKESPEQDPGECYAHLAIDPKTTAVYLMEPSGDPEKLGDTLEAFLEKLEKA